MRPAREDLFWAKVDRAGPVPDYQPDLGPCWLWTAGRDRMGYGRFGTPHAPHWSLAYRIAYEWLVGPIPEGLVIDHLCRVPACVNPAHLEPVTFRENLMRGLRKGPPAKDYCPYGHRKDEANTYVYRGHRSCRTCVRLRSRTNYDLNREQRRAYAREYQRRRRAALLS